MKYQRILRYVDEVARCGSIRKAADKLNVTSSAVNRRIMDLEEELGTQLFERRARGVNLTAAGEVFVRFLRAQESDAERMQSQIEELKGMRRGVVRIACSQALAVDFLPREIAAFRKQHGLVTFEVKVLDHERAMAALANYDIDLVLVFRPPYLANFQPLMLLEQRLVVLMRTDHPLAAKKILRLNDCTRYPVATIESGFGGRQLLDEYCARTGIPFQFAVQSNSFELLRGVVAFGDLISFQIRIGAPKATRKLGIVSREIDDRDLPRANVVLGQLRGRNLPMPAAMFAERLRRSLDTARKNS